MTLTHNTMNVRLSVHHNEVGTSSQMMEKQSIEVSTVMQFLPPAPERTLVIRKEAAEKKAESSIQHLLSFEACKWLELREESSSEAEEECVALRYSEDEGGCAARMYAEDPPSVFQFRCTKDWYTSYDGFAIKYVNNSIDYIVKLK